MKERSVFTWDVPTFGSSERGYLSVIESAKGFPFRIQRAYWIHGVPEGAGRGGHAHRDTGQMFFCLAGRCVFLAESADGSREIHALAAPQQGLYIGPLVWHTMAEFTPDTIVLALASSLYDEDDYIRDYAEFLKLR